MIQLVKLCMAFLLSLLLLQSGISYSQSARIDSLLENITSCQRNYTDSVYTSGLFPSKRHYLKKLKYEREDDNIFFTGLIVWTLRTQRHLLTNKNQILTDSICVRAIKNYPLYRNKYGDCTYNFWQPRAGRHFPNDTYFSKRTKYALPDDLDDTAVLYLSNNHTDSLKKKLKLKMASYANCNGKVIRNTFKKYKHYKAYNTWFGKRISNDFDLAVLCNAMLWVLNNKFEINEYDSATIKLIQDMVISGEHIKYAHYVSPHYQRPAIILYHLSKLVSAHSEMFLLIRDRLITDLKSQYQYSVSPVDMLLLSTSLARFGIYAAIPLKLSFKDFEHFYYFVANMTSVAPNPVKGWFAKSKWTNFYYRCEGYYLTLLLENECMNLARE